MLYISMNLEMYKLFNFHVSFYSKKINRRSQSVLNFRSLLIRMQLYSARTIAKYKHWFLHQIKQNLHNPNTHTIKEVDFPGKIKVYFQRSPKLQRTCELKCCFSLLNVACQGDYCVECSECDQAGNLVQLFRLS